MLVRLDPKTGIKRDRTKLEIAEDAKQSAAFLRQRARELSSVGAAVHVLAANSELMKDLSDAMKAEEGRIKKLADDTERAAAAEEKSARRSARATGTGG